MDPVKCLRENMAELHDEYMVSRIGVFGSFARGEETEESDVDVIVEFSQRVDLFHVAGLQYYLAEILGRKVDLVTAGALKPLIRDRILNEVEYV